MIRLMILIVYFDTSTKNVVKGWELEDHPIQARAGGDLGQHCSCGDGEKRSDKKYVLQVEVTGLADGLNKDMKIESFKR